MPWSLWRGGQCLGEVVVDLPVQPNPRVDVLVCGLFKPTVAFTDIGRLSQHRISFPNVPERVSVTRWDEVSPEPGPQNLRQLTPEEAAGIPAESQFFVHSPDGEIVSADSIWLHSVLVPGGRGPWPDLCRAHGSEGMAWSLMASCRSDEGSFDASSG